jgi:hypothetical protein
MLNYDFDAILRSLFSPQEMTELRTELAFLLINADANPGSNREGHQAARTGIDFDHNINIDRIYNRLNIFDLIAGNTKIARALNRIVEFGRNDPHIVATLSILLLHSLLCNNNGTLRNEIKTAFFPHGIHLVPGDRAENECLNVFTKQLFDYILPSFNGHLMTIEMPIENKDFPTFVHQVFRTLAVFDVDRPNIPLADRNYLLIALEFITPSRRNAYLEDPTCFDALAREIDEKIRSSKGSLAGYFHLHPKNGSAIGISGTITLSTLAVTTAIVASIFSGGLVPIITSGIAFIILTSYLIAYITIAIKASNLNCYTQLPPPPRRPVNSVNNSSTLCADTNCSDHNAGIPEREPTPVAL